MSLEKMDELFGVTQLVQQKYADPEIASNAGDAPKTVSIDARDKALEEQDRLTRGHLAPGVQGI